jgi:hypothetical protein
MALFPELRIHLQHKQQSQERVVRVINSTARGMKLSLGDDEIFSSGMVGKFQGDGVGAKPIRRGRGNLAFSPYRSVPDAINSNSILIQLP